MTCMGKIAEIVKIEIKQFFIRKIPRFELELYNIGFSCDPLTNCKKTVFPLFTVSIQKKKFLNWNMSCMEKFAEIVKIEIEHYLFQLWSVDGSMSL